MKTSGRFFLSKLVRVNDTMWALGQSTLLRQRGSGLEWQRIESLKLDSTMQTGSPAAGSPAAVPPAAPSAPPNR